MDLIVQKDGEVNGEQKDGEINSQQRSLQVNGQQENNNQITQTSEFYRDKIISALGVFHNRENETDSYRRVDTNIPFYAHVVNDLYYQDLDTIPNERKEFIYKYLRRLIFPVVKEGINGIYHGRNEKRKVLTTPLGKKSVKIKDEIIQNKPYVSEYYEDGELSKDSLDKFEEYYGMYETVIAKRVQSELKKLNPKEIDQNNIKNIIINVVTEFTYILKAFTDKLTLEEFEMLFSKHSQESVKSKNDVEGVIGVCKSMTDFYENFNYVENLPDDEGYLGENGEKEEKGIYDDLLEMLKSFSPSALIYDEGKVHFSHSRLSESIKNHFEESFIDIAEMFQHWLYSTNFSYKDLLKISKEFFNFHKQFNILKENDTAFSDTSFEKFVENIFSQSKESGEGISKIFPQKYQYNSFRQLFEIINNIDSQTDSLTLKNLYNQLLDEKKLSSQKVEYMDISDIPLKDLSYDLLNKAGPDGRKAYFNDNVYQLNQDNEIIGFNFYTPKNKNDQTLQRFAKYYSIKHKGYRTKKDKIIDELLSILEDFNGNNPQTIENFQKDDIYKEQLLVSRFRYNLAEKQVLKENPNIDNLNAKELTEELLNRKMYGVTEDLLNDADESILDSNITFRNGGHENKLHNTAIWDLAELIENRKHRFRKKPINLKNTDHYALDNPQELGGEKILFKDISTLYLPNGDDNSPREVEQYLTTMLEYTVLLLQRKKSNNSKYNTAKELFEKYGIKENDFGTLFKLRKFFKYTQYIHKIAKKLYEKGIKEHKELINLLEKTQDGMVDENTLAYEVGPAKKFRRIFEKLIKSYSGDIREMGDLGRKRYIGESLDDCKQKMNKLVSLIKNNPELNIRIVQGIAEDSVGNKSERGPKSTQYRDMKLQFKNSDGVLIEEQFIVKEMFEWKEEGISQEILESYFENKILPINQDFIDELHRRADAEGIKIPRFLLSIIPQGKYLNTKLDKYTQQGEIINSDHIYKLHRGSGNQNFVEIMEYIESLVYDKQWGKVMAKNTKKYYEKKKIAA